MVRFIFAFLISSVCWAERDLSLFFDPAVNNVTFPKQYVDYDISKGNELHLGPFFIREFDIQLNVSREMVEISELEFGLEVIKRMVPVYLVSFTWPTQFIATGTLEIVDEENRVRWRREITGADIRAWEQIVQEQTSKAREKNMFDRAAEKNAEAGEERAKKGIAHLKGLDRVHWRSQYGIHGPEVVALPIWRLDLPFRFCLHYDSDEGRVGVCSKRYVMQRKKTALSMVPAAQGSVRPRILLNDRETNLKGSAVFLDEKTPMKFQAMLQDGSHLEFVSYPKKVNIIDLALSEDKKYIRIAGWGAPPIGEFETIELHDKAFLHFLNFMPTIGDFRNFWRIRVPSSYSQFFIQGHGGAPFSQRIAFDDLPNEAIRPFVEEHSTETTYSSKLYLQGRYKPGSTVSSKQNKAEMLTADTFEWEFAAPLQGHYNRSYLDVSDGKKTWRTSYEVYRGFPSELSLRGTGVLSTDLSILVMGEISAQSWFESVVGWQNKLLSLKRWGIAAKYFQTLFGFSFNGGPSEFLKLQVQNFEFKYRFTPGIWGRDPSIGIMAAQQNVYFYDRSTNMAGIGVFWMRSMPEIFDDIFNIIPFMRYPKWVDLEFIYYAMPLDRQRELGSLNFNVNFHGRVQWSERWFGEASFGVKSYDFIDTYELVQRAVGVAYGTVGLGLNF